MITQGTIAATFSLDEEVLESLDHHCWVCGSDGDCGNVGIRRVTDCAQLEQSMPPQEWFIEFKRVVYERDTPVCDRDGNPLGCSASGEIFREIKDYVEVRIPIMESYLKGMTPEQAYDQFLIDNHEDSQE